MSVPIDNLDPYVYFAKLADVSERPAHANPDGDTVWLTVDQGFRHKTVLKIRLAGIDAPTLSSPDGATSRDYLNALLKDRQLKVQTFKQVTSDAEQYSEDRWIGLIYARQTDGSWLDTSHAMLVSNNAVSYNPST